MARRRKKRTKGAPFVQKLMVVAAGVVAAVCIASVGYGVFLRAAGDDADVPARFRIEVLNGTGVDGLARAAARRLTKLGVDVLAVENADAFAYEETVLIARKKNEDVWLLGEMIGCDNVIEQLQKNSRVDASLIVGADYARLKLGLDADSSLLE